MEQHEYCKARETYHHAVLLDNPHGVRMLQLGITSHLNGLCSLQFDLAGYVIQLARCAYPALSNDEQMTMPGKLCTTSQLLTEYSSIHLHSVVRTSENRLLSLNDLGCVTSEKCESLNFERGRS